MTAATFSTAPVAGADLAVVIVDLPGAASALTPAVPRPPRAARRQEMGVPNGTPVATEPSRQALRRLAQPVLRVRPATGAPNGDRVWKGPPEAVLPRVPRRLRASEGPEPGRAPARGRETPVGERNRTEAGSAARPQSAPRRTPPRFEPGSAHRDLLLAGLAPEQRPIAERLAAGGIPAVRRAIAEERERARSEGRPEVSGEAILALAEQLAPSVKQATGWTGPRRLSPSSSRFPCVTCARRSPLRPRGTRRPESSTESSVKSSSGG